MLAQQRGNDLNKLSGTIQADILKEYKAQGFEGNISIEYGRPSLKGRVPGKDIDPFEGREWLKQMVRVGTDSIPVVVLTTSEAEEDVLRSYELQANCYLTKPVQLDAFENLVKSINDFWLTKVKLPQQSQSG